ncbi:MAG: hypothetical protein ACR2JM_02220 [Mycobacterium sp.]
MRRAPVQILSAAATTALWLSGCAAAPQPSPAVPPASTAVPNSGESPASPGVEVPPAPPPQALADVLLKLGDPAVPGAAKLSLVQDAGPPDAAALDAFANALHNSGLTPIAVSASDIRWSDAHPGEVMAIIKITGPAEFAGPHTAAEPDNSGEFAFPMEFRRDGGDWQLTRDTAQELLAFGNARGGITPPPGSTTPPR